MNRLSLSNINFGLFKIGELFKIENCKCSKVSNLPIGNIPYIGATNRNNGVLSFIKNEKKILTKGNCIVFICDGEGSIGYSLYKKEDFIGSTTLKTGRNRFLNKYNALFITTMADTVRSKYNFGYKRNEKHLKSERIKLPIDINNNPNWQFMEEYMKQKENDQLEKIINYYQSKLHRSLPSIPRLEDIEWGEFFFNQLFSEIKRGKRLTKANQKNGKMPYISSTLTNNGLDNYINNTNGVRIFKDCLTIANSGSVGATFYHPYKFVASDHVTSLKRKKTNQYIYSFLATLLKTMEEKYSFNREINDKRIMREKILLPLDDKGDPDWQFMENYIKIKENEQIEKII